MSLGEVEENLRGNNSFRQLVIILLGETLMGEIFVTFQKIRHFHPTKFHPKTYSGHTEERSIGRTSELVPCLTTGK